LSNEVGPRIALFLCVVVSFLLVGMHGMQVPVGVLLLLELKRTGLLAIAPGCKKGGLMIFRHNKIQDKPVHVARKGADSKLEEFLFLVTQD
jgi:hypothetical protein